MRTLTTVVAMGAMLSLAACSSGTGAGSTSSATTRKYSAQARAVVQQYKATQPAITVEPIAQKPPKTGQSLIYVSCPLPVCSTLSTAMKEAAGDLGWRFKEMDSTMTPTSYVSTVNSALQLKPDMLALAPFAPNDLIKSQLAKAKAQGIVVTETAPLGDRAQVDGPMQTIYNGYPLFRQSGNLMGATMLADGGSASNTVFVWDPSLAPIWQGVKDGINQWISKTGGDVPILKISTSQVGTGIPSQVVSYLRSHPQVKYVAFALADLDAGVPDALAAAGLSDKVKIISRAPQGSTLADIKRGRQWASVGEETAASSWRAVDGLIRLSEGQTPAKSDAWFEPAGWHQIFTADNITDTSQAPLTPGVPDAFLTAWGVK